MPSISDRLNEAMQMRQMKQIDLVKATGISKAAISTYISGAYEPKSRNLMKLAKVLNVSEEWLTGQETKDMVYKDIRVNVYDFLYEGYVENFLKLEKNVVGSEFLSIQNISDNTYFGLIVNDASMAPHIMKGDVIIVQEQDFASDDDLIVVKVADNDVMCRKIKYLEKGVSFIPFNYNYEPLIYTNEEIKEMPVKILGKIIETRHKF